MQVKTLPLKSESKREHIKQATNPSLIKVAEHFKTIQEQPKQNKHIQPVKILLTSTKSMDKIRIKLVAITKNEADRAAIASRENRIAIKSPSLVWWFFVLSGFVLLLVSLNEGIFLYLLAAYCPAESAEVANKI